MPEPRERWITMKGAHVLTGGNGEIKAGLGGKKLGVPAIEKPKGHGTSTPAQAHPAVSKADAPAQSVAHVTGKAAHAAARVPLDAAQKTALVNYSGAMFRTVNPALRSGKPISRADKKDVERIDKAFSKAALTSPVTVYRGVSGAVAAKLTAGATFKDGAFVSTSSDKGHAENFVRGDGSALMEIRVPQGAKAISVRDLSQFGKSEQEILLDRGGQYRVVEVKPKRRGSPQTIVVELVKG